MTNAVDLLAGTGHALEPFPYTMCAPGSDREVMKIRGMDPSLSKRKQGNMDTNISAALDFNARAPDRNGWRLRPL